MDSRLVAVVGGALGAAITEAVPVSGGCVDAAYRVRLADGRLAFVKADGAAASGRYRAEAAGLRWLAAAAALGVPEVLAVSDTEPGPPFLALAWIPPGPHGDATDERLGRGLAALHRSGAPSYGWGRPGFIGPLPQDNTPTVTWAELYGHRRLLPMAERAHRLGHLPDGTLSRVAALVDRLELLVEPAEPPARLHGDLWSGNVHVDAHGAPWLVDPAPYGGSREVDLAMLRLFGGDQRRVLAAYEEVFPLAPGSEGRVALYQLYPLLVHVVLFGAGYVGGVQRALDAYR